MVTSARLMMKSAPNLAINSPKHIYHSIICIGALVAHREDGGRWIVHALGAPHVGERSEKELIASFVDRIAALSPQLVTFNGASFDLSVLRYRAMVHGVAAPGLSSRPCLVVAERTGLSSPSVDLYD
jgi:DNA polymerase elongation subunit (family B)